MWVRTVVGRAIHVLSKTVVDKSGQALRAWVPSQDEGVPMALTLESKQTPWVGMLRESKNCAVFAALSPIWLDPDIPDV